MKLNRLNHRLSLGPIAPQKSEAPQSIYTNQSQRGIALVITLVMLSVTLVMAIAFLALARRERSSVSTTTDTTTAKLAADSALAAAESQILANVLATNVSTFNFSLLVSTNYINYNGFTQGVASPLNVNYTHVSAPFGLLNAADFVQNIANLQYLPRVPVFIQTNANGSSDFRYYLDLNRNGAFDDTAYIDNSATNGPISEVGDPQWVGILARPDMPHSANNQFLARYAFIALPIGNTLDINAIHNQTLSSSITPNQAMDLNQDGFFRNESVGSWEINLAAFLADLNSDEWNPQNNLYSYNQVGSPASANKGAAFEDAYAILTNRYAGFYASLAVPGAGVLPPNISLYDSLVNEGIDGYTLGNLMTSPQRPAVVIPRNRPPWVGSDNTNHFYNLPSDLFNPGESSGDFVRRLTAAGNSIGVNGIGTNYDRYTFYHLLAQLGTDSDPDDGKMNLNYRNLTNGVVVPNMETNCFVWSPIEFFTNAADRMLRLYTTNWFAANPYNYLQTYYGLLPTNLNNPPPGFYHEYYYNALGTYVTNDATGFGLTNFSSSKYLGWTNVVPGFGVANIPVYVNGEFVYSPAVNRVLQLAANLYDASTTNFYPSVFRPLFEHDGLGNVFIVGYTNLSAGSNTVSGVFDLQLSTPYDPPSLTNYGGFAQSLFPLTTNSVGINVYGVPWIIGAKKGFPAFNKFGMQTIVQATRKLQIARSSIPTDVHSTKFLTNQLIAFSVKNVLNADCWNSYTNEYRYPLNIMAQDTISMVISNDAGAPPNYFYNYQIGSNTYINPWPGYNSSSAELTALSFTNPLSATVMLLSNSDFYFGTSPPGVTGFYPDSLGYGWESNNYNLTFPRFTLFVTNRLQLYMLDSSGGAGNIRVIDYVQLGGPQTSLDLTSAIETNNPTQIGYGSNMWSQSTDTYGVPYGIKNQLNASLSPITANGGTLYWTPSPNNEAMVQGFYSFMTGAASSSGPYPSISPNDPIFQSYATNYVAQVPYTPTATVSYYTAWQVNDPLVHYLASDLTFVGEERPSQAQTGLRVQYGAIGDILTYPTFNSVNDRYQPWSVAAPNNPPQAGPNAQVPTTFNFYVKDPLIWSSDYWAFLTNRYPTVGWIGRVHRGTPWQTVYLKSHDVLHSLEGNEISSGTNTWSVWTGDYNSVDAANSSPAQDRLLFDLFTSRLNDNSARGTLSVNQTNLAAWSAIFSGMVVLKNTANLPANPNPNPKFASIYQTVPVTTAPLTIQPAALGGAVQTLLDGINFTRSGTNAASAFTNADGMVGNFEHAGDILSSPVLTENSPFLNTNVTQKEYGISDAVYEWLPQQMMGLVRGPRAPRYVIYGYGQSLRPAQNGLVSSGPFFGLVTNYQVVAESAVRAVVSVQAHVDLSGNYPVTNYTTRVENYNVLPSD